MASLPCRATQPGCPVRAVNLSHTTTYATFRRLHRSVLDGSECSASVYVHHLRLFLLQSTSFHHHTAFSNLWPMPESPEGESKGKGSERRSDCDGYIQLSFSTSYLCVGHLRDLLVKYRTSVDPLAAKVRQLQIRYCTIIFLHLSEPKFSFPSSWHTGKLSVAGENTALHLYCTILCSFASMNLEDYRQETVQHSRVLHRSSAGRNWRIGSLADNETGT